MNGNNTQSKEGFINALGHPRKKELAEMLLAEEVNVEAVREAGYDRVTVAEMAREISRNVEGMEDFSVEWPAEVAEETVATEEGADTAETANADQSNVQTGQDTTAPATDAPAAVDPNAAPEGQVETDPNAAPTNDAPQG